MQDKNPTTHARSFLSQSSQLLSSTYEFPVPVGTRQGFDVCGRNGHFEGKLINAVAGHVALFLFSPECSM
jgi:hypothetical protein